MKLKDLVKATSMMYSESDVDNFIFMLLQNNMRVMGAKTMNKIQDKAANSSLKTYLKKQLAINGIRVETSQNKSTRRGASLGNEKGSRDSGGFNNSFYGTIAEERSLRRSAYEFNKLVYGVQSD